MNAILLLDKSVLPDMRDDLVKRCGNKLDKIGVVDFCEVALYRIQRYTEKQAQAKQMHNQLLTSGSVQDVDSSILRSNQSMARSAASLAAAVPTHSGFTSSDLSSMVRSLTEMFDQV